MEGGTMKKKSCLRLGLALLLVLGWGSFPTCAWAIDVGWMHKGVRLWYFGGIDGGGGPSSNAEEAYLFDATAGTQASLTHHSAFEYWSNTKPVETGTYPLQGMGPCWIHPFVLQNLAVGDSWLGRQIIYVERLLYTYETFPSPLQPPLLPAWALFRITPQRELVKISYQLSYFSVGSAYFDTEAGILLFILGRDALFE
jgi:hypothetical protein